MESGAKPSKDLLTSRFTNETAGKHLNTRNNKPLLRIPRDSERGIVGMGVCHVIATGYGRNAGGTESKRCLVYWKFGSVYREWDGLVFSHLT